LKLFQRLAIPIRSGTPKLLNIQPSIMIQPNNVILCSPVLRNLQPMEFDVLFLMPTLCDLEILFVHPLRFNIASLIDAARFKIQNESFFGSIE
jgi:hypothetical protein